MAVGKASTAADGGGTTADHAAAGPVEPVPNPLTGRLPYLVTIDEMVQQFWQSSSHGRAITQQVKSGLCCIGEPDADVCN